MAFSTIPVVCLTLDKWETVSGQFGAISAPGYHITYGNRCVANIHLPPSWEDKVQPVVPACEGCLTAHPTLYELYARGAWPNVNRSSLKVHSLEQVIGAAAVLQAR